MIPTSRPSSRLDFISAKNFSSPRTMSSMLTKTVSILGTLTFFSVSKPLVSALAMLCSNRNWTSAWESKVHFAFYGMRKMSKKNQDYLRGFLSPWLLGGVLGQLIGVPGTWPRGQASLGTCQRSSLSGWCWPGSDARSLDQSFWMSPTQVS